jgi:hypothetical protein
MDQGNRDGAIADYQKALELEPFFPSVERDEALFIFSGRS